MGEVKNAVSLNYRYSGAWGEISTRINARQNVISIFIALTFPVLGLCLTDDSFSILLWLIPPVTVLSTLLVKMHEEMIGNLHNYCRWCEQIDNDEGELPSYHVDSDPWSSKNPKIRNKNDIVLQFLFNLPIVTAISVLLNVNSVWWDKGQYQSILGAAIVFLGCLIFSIYTLGSIKNTRENLYNQIWSPRPHT